MIIISEIDDDYNEDNENDYDLDCEEEVEEELEEKIENLKEIDDDLEEKKIEVSEKIQEFKRKSSGVENLSKQDIDIKNYYKDSSLKTEKILHDTKNELLNNEKTDQLIAFKLKNDTCSLYDKSYLTEIGLKKKIDLDGIPDEISFFLNMRRIKVKELARNIPKIRDNENIILKKEKTQICKNVVNSNQNDNSNEINDAHSLGKKDLQQNEEINEKTEILIEILKVLINLIAQENSQSDNFKKDILKILNKRN